MRLLVALVALTLAACSHTITVTSGETSCKVQRETSINAEQIATIVRPVVTATGLPLRELKPAPTTTIESQECDKKVCISLVGDTCSVQINE